MRMFRKRNENGFLPVTVRRLIDWDEPNGAGCIVSDMITKEGWKVGYLFRDEPLENQPDSGWRFFKGDENEEYAGDSANHHVSAINTVCSYDPDIIPYLRRPVGTRLIRVAGGKFMEDDGTQPVCVEKQ